MNGQMKVITGRNHWIKHFSVDILNKCSIIPKGGSPIKFYKPIEYIKIDIANQFGLDREQFEDRIRWVDANDQSLEKFENKAKDKYRYAAAILAFREVQAGKPTGHLVGLDACASGPQIMSALMRDAVGAENTSLIGKIRNCVYVKTTDAMNSFLTTAQHFLRNTVKYALMPFYYGSKAKPKMAFGEETDELKAFYRAQAQVCPGAAYLMPIMANSWNPFAKEHTWALPDGFIARVKVTSVKESKIEVDELDHASFMYQYTRIEGTEKGVANIANPIQSIDGYIVRELCRRCDHDKIQFRRVLSLLKQRARQIRLNGVELDSIQKIWNAQNVMSLVDLEDLIWDDISRFDFNYTDQLIVLVKRCLSRPSFPVITVHDEFKCHPNYMNYVRMTYVEIMVEISDGTLIDDILSKLFGEPVKIKKMADSISDEILDSEYALS
jgi:hypothetical protein